MRKKIAGDTGDVWTSTAIDADYQTCYVLLCLGCRGSRHVSAREFIGHVAKRIEGRVQITSDLLVAVEDAFGGYADYGSVVSVNDWENRHSN